MATIQARKSRGNKYWYIVESRRINGKPRPITLAYLGKPEDLLRRIQGLHGEIKLKSYSHGTIAALLGLANSLDICQILNKYVNSPRPYFAKKPIRNNLTVGATLLLAAIGRVCNPTSKQSWSDWAKTTSLSYLMRHSLSKIDSQHFWDLMDAFPCEAIEKAEEEILQKVLNAYPASGDTLFYDTTNFFTYIHTTNEHCTIAKRGKNKQKRNDLRQIGMALIVSQKEKLPLFHLTYEGNRHDSKIFTKIITKLKTRCQKIGIDINQQTIIFDRGNNSKKNLLILKNEGIHYVGALVPYQHKNIVLDAIKYFSGKAKTVYREKRKIWGDDKTVVVFISDGLKANQLAWLYSSLEEIEIKLQKLQWLLLKKNLSKNEVILRIDKIIEGRTNVINYDIQDIDNEKIQFNYVINQTGLNNLEEQAGLRILITNRHDWDNEKIIDAYNGQSHIEKSFRDLKNPRYLAIRPQYHWTDQKIKVHFFICIIGFLLSSVLFYRVNQKNDNCLSLALLIKTLNNVRLGTILEKSGKRGKLKAHYQLEEMNAFEKTIVKILLLEQFHLKRPQFDGLRVYTN